MLTVTYNGKSRRIKKERGMLVRDALRRAGISPELVIVRVGGAITPDEEPVKEGQKLEVFKVVSGG